MFETFDSLWLRLKNDLLIEIELTHGVMVRVVASRAIYHGFETWAKPNTTKLVFASSQLSMHH